MHSEAIVIPTTSACAAISRISAGRLEARPDRLPVDAAVAQLGRRRARQASSDLARASAGRSPATLWPRVRRRRREPEVQGDEVVGADEACRRRARRRSEPTEPIASDPVAAELGEGGEVARVVDPRGGRVAVEAVALEQHLLAALVDPDRAARRSRRHVARSRPPGSLPRIECPPISASRPIRRILFAALERLEAAQQLAGGDAARAGGLDRVPRAAGRWSRRRSSRDRRRARSRATISRSAASGPPGAKPTAIRSRRRGDPLVRGGRRRRRSSSRSSPAASASSRRRQRRHRRRPVAPPAVGPRAEHVHAVDDQPLHAPDRSGRRRLTDPDQRLAAAAGTR